MLSGLKKLFFLTFACGHDVIMLTSLSLYVMTGIILSSAFSYFVNARNGVDALHSRKQFAE